MSLGSALIIKSAGCARRQPLLLKRPFCPDGFPGGVGVGGVTDKVWLGDSVFCVLCVRITLWAKLGGIRGRSAPWSWFIQRHLLDWAFQCILNTAKCHRVKVPEKPSLPVELCGTAVHECLSANVVVGAGVFLFVIRGHSLRYELWSAKAEIQYMLSGGAESEGGSPIPSDFPTHKKKANSAGFTDAWHLIDLSWKCICGTWRTNLFILITSNKPRSCSLLPNLAKHLCVCQIYATCLKSKWVKSPLQRRGGSVWSFFRQQLVLSLCLANKLMIKPSPFV